jgi:hypothetical protein
MLIVRWLAEHLLFSHEVLYSWTSLISSFVVGKVVGQSGKLLLASPAQSFFVPVPAGLMTVCFCLTILTEPYDRQSVTGAGSSRATSVPTFHSSFRHSSVMNVILWAQLRYSVSSHLKARKNYQAGKRIALTWSPATEKLVASSDRRFGR